MTDKSLTGSTAPNAKVREDDRRGGSVPGRRGNSPFEATDEQRAKVRALAKAFPENSNSGIAILLGISRETLEKHFRHDLDYGRAEMIAAIGSQMVNRAINAEAVDAEGKSLTKGDLDAQKFVLARRASWTTKVEVTPKDETESEITDLSGFSDEQLALYGELARTAQGWTGDDDDDGAEAAS